MRFDTLDHGYLFLTFYLLFLGTLAAAFCVLRKSRGNSLLAIAIVSITVQVGTFYWYLPFYATEGPGRFVEPGFTRLGICMCIFFVCSILALCFSYRQFPPALQRDYTLPSLKAGVIVVGAIACAIYVGLRLRSQSAELVLTQGLDVLGGVGYYDLRAELIEIGSTAPNRLASHFEVLTRKFLFCLLLSCSYFWSRYKSTKLATATLILCVILLLDEFIRFQKAPIVVVLAGAIIPYLIGYGESRGFRIIRKITLGFLAATIVFLLSALTFVITMGTSGKDIFWMVFERFFLVPAYTGSLYCQVYPELLPHVWFTTIAAVAALLNIPPQTQLGVISLDVAEAMFGKAFNANSSMVADAYANAGYMGVVLVCVGVFVFFTIVDRFVSKVRERHDITPVIIFYWSCIISFGNGASVFVIMANALWFIPLVYPVIFRQAPFSLPLIKAPDGAPEDAPLSGKLMSNGL
jgi:hypothetical protein